MKKKKAKVENQNTVEKENIINKTDEVLTKEMAKKKVPKQVSQEILKKIFKNLILAIVVMIYFISCNIVYTQLEWNQMEMITKAISGVFLLASIITLEFAYKRDSGTLTMTAIELLVLSIHALFIYHIITIYQFDFRTYLITSSYMFAIYYVLKSTVIYTRARTKYLKSLSDISEIVKDEPVIKEAKKRKDEPISEIEEQIKVKKEDKKSKTKSITKKTKSKKTTDKNAKKENMESSHNEEEDTIEKKKQVETKTKKKEATKKKGKEQNEIEEKEKKKIIKKDQEEKNENQKVSKTKKRTKQNKEEKQEETKNEQKEEKKEKLSNQMANQTCQKI